MDTILIVEDNEKNMKLVRDVLQVKGYATLEAVTGEDGVRLAKERLPALVLMDIQLPGISGIEALKRLRGRMAIVIICHRGALLALADIVSGVVVVLGAPSADPLGGMTQEQSVLTLRVADTYEALAAKSQALFAWVLACTDFDYVFKCDDDTYLYSDVFAQLRPTPYLGSPLWIEAGEAAGPVGVTTRPAT